MSLFFPQPGVRIFDFAREQSNLLMGKQLARTVDKTRFIAFPLQQTNGKTVYSVWKVPSYPDADAGVYLGDCAYNHDDLVEFCRLYNNGLLPEMIVILFCD